MSGDAHVRICESLGVQFPRATRLYLKIDGRLVLAYPVRYQSRSRVSPVAAVEFFIRGG